MRPELFQLGPFTIHTYTVLVDLGILVGVYIAYREAMRVGFDSDSFFDLAAWVVFAAIVGSRLYHVLFIDWNYYAADWLRIFRLWEGGFVFQGAFFGGLAAGLVYLWRRKLSFWVAADFTALGLVFGHAIGRVGCFFGGCCYGGLCDLPWGVVFPNLGIGPRHPTQLYEGLANLAIFGILFAFRKNKPFNGFLFLLYVMLYSATRFSIEFLRGDPSQMIGSLRVAQAVAAMTCAIAFLLFLFLTYRARRASDRVTVRLEERQQVS